MLLIRERNIFTLASKFLCAYFADLPKPVVLKATEALSLLVETESFVTDRDAFITDIESLIVLRTECLPALMTEFENRKYVRPLVDCIDRAKRMRDRK
jgi:hypothetical protein